MLKELVDAFRKAIKNYDSGRYKYCLDIESMTSDINDALPSGLYVDIEMGRTIDDPTSGKDEVDWEEKYNELSKQVAAENAKCRKLMDESMEYLKSFVAWINSSILKDKEKDNGESNNECNKD